MSPSSTDPRDASFLVELAPGLRIPSAALRMQFARSGGPGGQNVNKLNTKAELWVSIGEILGLRDDTRQRLEKLAGKRLTAAGEIHIVSETHRSQESNRAAALDKLRELLVEAMHRPRRAGRPSPAGLPGSDASNPRNAGET